MSIDASIGYNGATVFWSLKNGMSKQLLQEGFEKIGRPNLLPGEINDGPALKRALRKCFPSRADNLVRAIKGAVGFAIIEEAEGIDSSGQQKLEHREELRVAVSGTTLLSNPSDHLLLDKIKEQYLWEKQRITASKLGNVLVSVCSQLQGIPLRPRGGFYWMPNSSLSEWEEIVSVVESAHPQNKVWRIKTTTDQETVDAVCDSLMFEVEKELDLVTDALCSEDVVLGKRALKTKEKTALDLKDLVSTYEGILSRTLEDLSKKAEEVHSAAAFAVLQAV